MNTISTTITRGFGTPNERKIVVKNADPKLAWGTSKQGEIIATYSELRKMFGAPYGPSSDGKVFNEWILDIEGVVVTIHDYKFNGHTRNPEAWSIGGKSHAAVILLDDLIENSRA